MGLVDNIKSDGNELLKEGDVQGALECYAEALWLLQDPERKPDPKLKAVLHSNRSSCFATQAKTATSQKDRAALWDLAVLDAEKAVVACPSYEKGYHRLVSSKLRNFSLPAGQCSYVPALRDCWRFGPQCAALAELAIQAEEACEGLLSLDSIFLPPQLPARDLADVCTTQSLIKAVLWSHWRATGTPGAVPSGLQALPQDTFEGILTRGLPQPRGWAFAAELAKMMDMPLLPNVVLQLTVEYDVPAAGKCTIASWNRELQKPLCEHCFPCNKVPILELFRVIVKSVLSPFEPPRGRPQYVCFSAPAALAELKPLLAYCGMGMVAKVDPNAPGFENTTDRLWLLRASQTPIMRIRPQGVMGSFDDGADPQTTKVTSLRLM